MMKKDDDGKTYDEKRRKKVPRCSVKKKIVMKKVEKIKSWS